MWPGFLKQFSEAVGFAGSALFFQDHDSSQGHIAASHGYDPHYQRQYGEHFASVNVWLKRMADQTKSGDIRNSLSAGTGSELVRTEYYNDWLRPQDLFYGYGGTILRQGSVTTNITAMRPRRAGSFGSVETRILDLLMPHLQRVVQDVLQVEQGSLCPALHRLIKKGWISAAEGTSENNRHAKFYRLTAKSRKQLAIETTKWDKLARAIGRILRPAPEEIGS